MLSTSEVSSTDIGTTSPPVTDELVDIIVRPSVSGDELTVFKQAHQVETVETTQVLGFERWSLSAQSLETLLVTAATEDIAAADSIDYLQPNYALSAHVTATSTPNLGQLWGLENLGQTGGVPDADIDAPEAWTRSTGKGVVIGVIDSGIDYTHPDLINNLWTNPGEIPDNGIDDDGNGYVDDYYGYDFVNDDGDPMDDNGHGTHVAGTIAADGNNQFGAVGVAPDAQIMALKFLNSESEGSTFDAIQAIEYAMLMGADITNNSWGGTVYSQALSDAIAAAANMGQLFVAAAGNANLNTDLQPEYPAGYTLDNIISVGASTASDQLSEFSNYGLNSVDLVAPGSGIYSTLPNGSYGYLGGTSMAAPHVSGAAALLLAAYPGLSPSDLKATLLDATDPLTGLTNVVASGGRLNAFRALNEPKPSGKATLDLLAGNAFPGVNTLTDDDLLKQGTLTPDAIAFSPTSFSTSNSSLSSSLALDSPLQNGVAIDLAYAKTVVGPRLALTSLDQSRHGSIMLAGDVLSKIEDSLGSPVATYSDDLA